MDYFCERHALTHNDCVSPFRNGQNAAQLFFFEEIRAPQFKIDFGLWKYLIKECLPLALSSIIIIIYSRIDVIMLSIMKGDVPVGLYSAAYKLSDPFLLIPSALGVSLFPIMFKSFRNSREELIRIYELSFKYILIIMLPIAIITTLLADRIIMLIYGDAFEGSATALQLIWALIFTSLNSILSHLLVSMGEQKLSTVGHTLCAVVNVVLNFFPIPVLSYNGASIATVATSAVFFISRVFISFPNTCR